MTLLASGVIGAFLAAAWPVAASDGPAASPAAVPGAEEDAVLARFLARPDESHRRLRGVRHMRAEGLGKRAFMDVRVALDPAEGFTFQVLAEGGSRFLCDRAFRGLLLQEQAVYASRAQGRTAITADNYELTADGREGDGLVRLRAVPRRPEPALLDGRFVVTADTADLVRAEGRLARAPSFWISQVDVRRHYRRVQGHRLQVRLECVSELRLLGAVRIVVDFEYEMVDGDALRDR